MQALILAAGDSKRLRDLTKEVPKSFLKVDNKKLIEHHLDKLSEVGVENVTIVVGYKKELFYETIGNKYKNLSIDYVECNEYSTYNHGWSFYLSKEKIINRQEDVLVVHADTFYNIEMLEDLVQNDCNNIILADSQYTVKTNDEILVYGQDGVCSGTHFSHEEIEDSVGEFIGLHKFDFRGYEKFISYLENYFNENGKKVGYDRILGDFINDGSLKVNYKITTLPWININYVEDYEYAKKLARTFSSPANVYHKRLGGLRKLIDNKKIVRVIETHNGLTGILAEKVEVDTDNTIKSFDGMWLSSLTHSTSKGRPDIQYVDITSISNTINEIFEVTTKPMIVDADSGGLTEHFCFTVKTLERLGVSAVIIEDKIGAKRNSLFGTGAGQKQDSIEGFCYKISEGKRSQNTSEFMIIARVESLILKAGMADALKRSYSYIESGADAIMIHSKEKEPTEIIEFCRRFRKKDKTTPIVVVPSTYNSITEDDLRDIGVNVVIYANHLLRSAYPAMLNVCEKILSHGRSLEVDDVCMPIKEIITLIPGTDK